ncbi:MAG: hypothetical protein J4G04_07960 [Nitrosopumilaceae archaeon]|nr:hypothetical protein [Nitrosopumilaceae archaeon]
MDQNEKHELLLYRLLNLDQNVRFAAISDKDGNLLARAVRPDLQTILTPDETKNFTKWTSEAWNLRRAHHPKLGMELYNISVFEKVRRATFALGDDRLVLATIDNKGGMMQILDKILNLVLYKDYTHD